MVLAYHIILSAYGFWLPNDPRGSWSDFIREWNLLRYGPATKVDTRRSVAAAPHDVALRLAAKAALKYKPVQFDGLQARAIARGFDDAALEADYAIYSLAILPDHAHVVVGRHSRDIKRIMAHLKSKATMQLTSEGLHPFSAFAQSNGYVPSPWAAKGWSVFIDCDEHMLAAIAYVENNPLKEGLAAQHWNLVTPYRGKPRR